MCGGERQGVESITKNLQIIYINISVNSMLSITISHHCFYLLLSSASLRCSVYMVRRKIGYGVTIVTHSMNIAIDDKILGPRLPLPLPSIALVKMLLYSIRLTMRLRKLWFLIGTSVIGALYTPSRGDSSEG